MFNKTLLPNQKPTEEIILALRRHWLVLFFSFIKIALLSLIPIIFYLFLYYEIPSVLQSEITYPLLILGSSIFYLFIWLFLLNNFIDYYLDVWIVTNERIINIEQKNLFSRTVSEKNLEMMQDISSEVQGFLPTLFNYGTIIIQTAGAQIKFTFKDIPNAPEVTQKIIKVVNAYKTKHGLLKENL